MRALLLEPFAGISGDMLLGALVDLGVPVEELRKQIASLGLSDRVELGIAKMVKSGITATKVDVLVDGQMEMPDEVASGHSGHATLRSITDHLESSSLDAGIRLRAGEVFRRLAEAEARVHGGDPETVHFHEVGAIDAVVDVVCGVAAVAFLGVERVLSTPPSDGHGEVVSAHGVLPVPVPATSFILEGVPGRRIDVPFEMVTPTGAALLVTLADSIGTEFSFTPERTGYGAGTRQIDGRPNVLRASIGDVPELAGGAGDEVVMLETTVDDAIPEMWPHLMERLLEEGARDVWLTPVIMKKGRPGINLTVLADHESVPVLERMIFEETGTLGIRITSAGRKVLSRTMGTLETRFGMLQVKLSRLSDGDTWSVHPEYEICRVVARERGIRLRDVYDEISRASGDENALEIDEEN
ncbi:nickel pincer cofactor biosynthesis protein LarC [Candidatus Zixiibacteriota bacterium]